MKRFPANILAAMAVLLTGSEVFGQIQQVGHRQARHGDYIGYQSCDWNQCDPCMANGRRGGRIGNHCDSCDTGRGISRVWTDSCFNDTCLGRSCATKAYPDSGWAPPVRLPVNYDGTWYANYQPQAWYGNPGGGFIANYPTVYQPTDTTQLGYYYHKVPTWQSRPGMVPPTPRPSDYHSRICLGGNRSCNSCRSRYSNGGYSGGSCQAYNGNGYSVSGPQFTTPNGNQTVRPVAKQKQGLLGGFRFASLTDMLD